jgi:antirestriction protein ArdC
MSQKVYEIVTKKIIEGLEAGYIPWRKPWNGGGPANLISGKEYRGMNVLLLSMNNFVSPFYLTKKQVLEKGGRIEKEQFKKSQIVTYWNTTKVEDEKSGDEKHIPFMRFYEVWNVEQTDLPVPPVQLHQNNRLENAELIVGNMPKRPEIKHTNQAKACYSPGMDWVNVPSIDRFVSSEHYYATLFHELGHATGHCSRLDRDMTGFFGDASYSKEELIAELTAAFLCSVTGISNVHLEQNAQAYINNWLGVLKRDPKFVIQAASKAQKAADFIRGATADDLKVAA